MRTTSGTKLPTVGAAAAPSKMGDSRSSRCAPPRSFPTWAVHSVEQSVPGGSAMRRRSAPAPPADAPAAPMRSSYAATVRPGGGAYVHAIWSEFGVRLRATGERGR